MNNRSYMEDNEPNLKQETASMTNHCIYCGLEIPDDRSVCPFCMDERKAKMDLEDMIGMLEKLPDAIKFVNIVVEDETIGLIIPSETLLSLIKEDDEFLNYYIFSGPIKNIDIEGGIMYVDL